MSRFLLLFLFIIFAYFSAAIDLFVSQYFFTYDNFSGNALFTFLYNYGEKPAQITACISLVLFALSSLLSFLRDMQPIALYLFLTLVIGSFVINEQILKNHWGRPRPKQVTLMGGEQTFRPFYSPNFFHQPEPSRSFPCGHCTAGYYFIAFAYIGQRINRRLLYYFGIFTSLVFGTLLGIARIAQGGHFVTDVIFGALVMFATARALNFLFLPNQRLKKKEGVIERAH